jgi:small-conductance mechanosensitive channel
MLETIQGYVEQGREIALEWITSPAAYAQFGLLIGAFVLAILINRIIQPKLRHLINPGDAEGRIAQARRFVLLFLPLLLPLIAYTLTAAGEQVTRSIFGSGAVIAFGKRVFIFLAVRILVRDIITDGFLKAIGRYVFVPMAALYALGVLEPVQLWLGETRVGIGDIQFSLLAVLRAGIVGSILFWLGQWSANQGTTVIRAQTDMRPPTRELAAKAFEAVVYGIAFLLLVNILGLDLSALAILSGAIGVGLGFGLQKIASNFISGVILLLEGQATVGDFVELDGGESGTIIKMGARATILETFDGKWIVVPNEDFITTRIVNWSDAGSGNRLEVDFSVSYDTDINKIPEIVAKAVASHPSVLSVPEGPDVELRKFGDSGVDFAVEFWVEGIDDGKNKYSSEVMFLIWNALKDNNIEIPYPQREIRYRAGHAPATS